MVTPLEVNEATPDQVSYQRAPGFYFEGLILETLLCSSLLSAESKFTSFMFEVQKVFDIKSIPANQSASFVRLVMNEM